MCFLKYTPGTSRGLTVSCISCHHWLSYVCTDSCSAYTWWYIVFTVYYNNRHVKYWAVGKKNKWKQSHLRGLSENEFGVLDQALQGHSDIDDLCLLLLLAGVWNKLSIPGVEDDQTCRVKPEQVFVCERENIWHLSNTSTASSSTTGVRRGHKVLVCEFLPQLWRQSCYYGSDFWIWFLELFE